MLPRERLRFLPYFTLLLLTCCAVIFADCSMQPYADVTLAAMLPAPPCHAAMLLIAMLMQALLRRSAYTLIMMRGADFDAAIDAAP